MADAVVAVLDGYKADRNARDAAFQFMVEQVCRRLARRLKDQQVVAESQAEATPSGASARCGREVERYWPEALLCGSMLFDGEIPLCGKCSAVEIDRLRARLTESERQCAEQNAVLDE